MVYTRVLEEFRKSNAHEELERIGSSYNHVLKEALGDESHWIKPEMIRTTIPGLMARQARDARSTTTHEELEKRITQIEQADLKRLTPTPGLCQQFYNNALDLYAYVKGLHIERIQDITDFDLRGEVITISLAGIVYAEEALSICSQLPRKQPEQHDQLIDIKNYLHRLLIYRPAQPNKDQNTYKEISP